MRMPTGTEIPSPLALIDCKGEIENLIVETLFFGLLLILILFYSTLYSLSIVLARRARSKNQDSSLDFSLPTVSLVIATYNEEKNILKKINNIECLDYPIDKLEVIFVDSSTDRTRDLIKEYTKTTKFKVVLIEDERRGLATALNLGYSCASNDIIFKNDCNKFLEKGVIRTLVKHFSDSHIGAVCGRITTIHQYDKEIGYLSLMERLRIAEGYLDSTYNVCPTIAFRKSLFEPIDKRSVADEAEVALKIRRKGYKTLYDPEAGAAEMSPISTLARIKQKSRRAQGQIRLLFNNSDVMFNPKYGKYGLIILPANFFMMVLSPWLITLMTLFGFILLYEYFSFFSLPIIVSLILLILAAYEKSWPRTICGFIDAQFSLLIGSITLVIKGPDFKWERINKF